MAGLLFAAEPQRYPSGTWPQEYTVKRDETSGTLTLSTPYYVVQHDLKQGGAIKTVKLIYGKSENLLVQPAECSISVTGKNGGTYGDLKDTAPKVTVDGNGNTRTVTVECALYDTKGNNSGIKVTTRYEYRWGYIRIHREFSLPASTKEISLINAFSAIFHPSLEQYGYRQGMAEQEGNDPFGFGVMQWRKLRAGAFFDPPLQTRFVPRYLTLLNPGVEGIEWFVSDNLSQWDYQVSGKPGYGYCSVSSSINPLGVAVAIQPLNIQGVVPAKDSYSFDFYIGFPILTGHANKSWLHSSFNRNKGDWVSEEQVKNWADSGIRTVHCHNDGDSYGDGLFWHDGSYPPYPPDDMKKYDEVIDLCHKNGIRVATYFSNKELYPTTEAFKAHGDEWGRKPDDTGGLRHNMWGNFEFGAQMCLKSGWLSTLKVNIDTVLRNHKLDGVYYDWNVGLYCNNPLHMGKSTNGVSGNTGTLALSPTGHWDIDELLELMEWTRERIGPQGLVILHNTMVPMFTTENFADYVVGMEWGYGLLSRQVPPVNDLPPEWQFAGARSRGVIGYGTIAENAPERLRKVMAMETLLTGVAPWPANQEAIDLYKILKPLGDLTQYRFEDWRNTAVHLDDPECISAVYSRTGEAWILLGNPNAVPKQVACRLSVENLPFPLTAITTVTLSGSSESIRLDTIKLTGSGETVTVPGDSAVLLQVK